MRPSAAPILAALTTLACTGSLPAVTLLPCGAGSAAALAGCVEERRYVADLRFVAAEREPGSAHWQAVQDLVFTRLVDLGYDVERHAADGAVNVVGKRRGAMNPEEEIVVSAHYDHIPGCAGADDNGSGVAAALEIARVLATTNFARTVTVALWDLEEVGLVGSGAYATRARWRGEDVRMAYVLETMGFASEQPDSQRIPVGFDVVYRRQVAEVAANDNRGDFVAVVVDAAARQAEELVGAYAQAVGLPAIMLHTAPQRLPFTRDLRRSDHQSFWSAGFPAMMLTDSANFRNPGYHCLQGPDTVDSLDHVFATRIARAVAYAAATQAGLP